MISAVVDFASLVIMNIETESKLYYEAIYERKINIKNLSGFTCFKAFVKQLLDKLRRKTYKSIKHRMIAFFSHPGRAVISFSCS